MHNRILTRSLLFTLSALIVLLPSCYKNEIQFGNELINSDTRLITIDTVTPELSTYVLDSFATDGYGRLVVGRVVDPYLGTTNASSYFQLGLPTKTSITAELPTTAIYDSIELYLKPDSTWHGDTTKAQTFTLSELAYQPEYSYHDQLYNTSSVELRSVAAWGSKTLAYRPMRRDTISIRLSDTKGNELFQKIKNKAEEIQNETKWLNYLKGLVLQVASSDNGAIYSIPIGDSTISVRLHYHVTLPVRDERVIEFPLTRTAYQFNRVVTDRTGTSLEPTYRGQKLFPATKTTPYSFTQSGTGVMMKITFPSLRSVLKLAETVRLLDAKLILRPIETSWDYGVFPLPSSLFMVQTDERDLIGSTLASSSGSNLQASPQIDIITKHDTRYEYNVTSYISYLLNTAGTEKTGMFVMQETPGTAKMMDRAVFGSPDHPTQAYRTELQITIMALE